MSTVKERVQRGAELLDREIPGWERLIDLKVLDLGSPCRCVLGQIGRAADLGVAEPFNDLAADLELELDDLVSCAFEAPDGWTYDGLTRAWKTLIRERQAA